MLRHKVPKKDFRYTPYARVHPAFPPRVRGTIRALDPDARTERSLFCPFCRAPIARFLKDSPMNRIKLSLRVPPPQELLIRQLAERRGLTRYQALGRVVEAGLAALLDKPARSHEPAGEGYLASLEARLATIEALTDRSLFTASAAYAYARRAALRNDSDAKRSDSATSDAALSSYRRQRALAAEAVA